jgi:DNA-binding response OmpR family regulator
MSKIPGSVIVVEDEPLISIMVEDMACELGWRIDGTAQTEAGAFALLQRQRPTVAILDVNLGRGTSLAVAATCRDQGIPVVFTTGYLAGDLPPECADAPVLLKPFTIGELAAALRQSVEKTST